MGPKSKEDVLSAILADEPYLMEDLLKKAKQAGLSRDQVYRGVRNMEKWGKAVWIKRAGGYKAVVALKEYEKKAHELARGKLGISTPELLAKWVALEEEIVKLLNQLPNVYPSVDNLLFGVYTATVPPAPFRKWVKLDVEEDPLFKSLGGYSWFKPILRILGQFRRESEEFWVMGQQLNSKIRNWVESEVFERIPSKKWTKFKTDWLGEFSESFFRLTMLRVEGGHEKFSKQLRDAKTFYRKSGPLLPAIWMGVLIQPWSWRGLPRGWEDELNELFINMLGELDNSRFSADATKLRRKLKKLESLRSGGKKELRIILAKGRTPGGLWILLKQ